MATTTTVQLGSYNPLTDAFSLGLDINDRATYFVDEIKTPQPKKQTVELWNIRTVGTRYVKQQHESREITVTLYIQAATVPLLLTALQNLQSQVEGMSVGVNPANATTPPVLKLQAPNATTAKYSLVQLTAHTIEYAVKELISNPAKLGGKKRISLIFTCYPFSFSIPRQVLANGCANPGFEAPMGGGNATTYPTVFNDSFANVNAYTLVAGSAPSVTSNVMTIPSGTSVSFGSPAWGALSNWQVRFQWVTGLSAFFVLHETDATHILYAVVNGSTLQLVHNVGGTTHTLASVTATLTTSTFYWIQIRQFPTVSGNPPQVVAFLSADSSGVPGSNIATAGPVATFDAVTALAGKPQLQAVGAALAVGGTFANVHLVQLWGPGGWNFTPSQGGTTGQASGAWDGSRSELGMSGTATLGTQTYPGGPVTSFGAGRIDLPPAGTVSCFWSPYVGGAPAGTNAIPVQTGGNTIQFAVWVRQAGLGASAQVALQQAQFDVNGNNLNVTTNLVVKTAAQLGIGWTQMTGSVVTNASCAYITSVLLVTDTTAGSANGTVWFDNVQVWDQTRTGMATMPYCELSFPSSPAQLMVSGLLGDAPAAALTAVGTYLTTWAVGATIRLTVGRCAQSAAARQLVLGTPIIGGLQLPLVDSTSYGGYLVKSALNDANWNDTFFGAYLRGDAAAGTYHFWQRFWSNQTAGNLKAIQGQWTVYEVIGPNGPANTFTGELATELMSNAFLNPLAAAAASTWVPVDLGQVIIPTHARGALMDLSQYLVQVTSYWQDANHTGSSFMQGGWNALMPVDARMLNLGLLNNGNGLGAPTGLWFYADGLGESLGFPPTISFNAPGTLSVPQPGPAGGSNGPSTGATVTAASLTTTADTFLELDPLVTVGSTPVNQFLAILTDSVGSIWPVSTELVYQPKYLYPL